MFDQIVNMDQPLTDYKRFFISNYINEKNTTTFASEIDDVVKFW